MFPHMKTIELKFDGRGRRSSVQYVKYVVGDIGYLEIKGQLCKNYLFVNENFHRSVLDGNILKIRCLSCMKNVELEEMTLIFWPLFYVIIFYPELRFTDIRTKYYLFGFEQSLH